MRSTLFKCLLKSANFSLSPSLMHTKETAYKVVVKAGINTQKGTDKII